MKMIHNWSGIDTTLKIWLSLVFLALTASLQAQCDTLSSEQRNEQALDMLSRLNNEGILAIRLKGYERQIRELDRLMGAEGLSESTYEKLLAKKMSYLEKRETTFEVISAAFSAHYTFSDVVFYYSEDQDDIGNPNALMWLDVSGKVLKDVDIDQRIVAILQEGSTSNLSLEAFLLRRPDLQPFCDPIPSYFRMNRFSTLLAFGEKGVAKKAEKMAADLDSSLRGLYDHLR